jgi:hypothetical protein
LRPGDSLRYWKNRRRKGESVGGAEALESEIKELIVEALALEDVDPQQIETDAALSARASGWTRSTRSRPGPGG